MMYGTRGFEKQLKIDNLTINISEFLSVLPKSIVFFASSG